MNIEANRRLVLLKPPGQGDGTLPAAAWVYRRASTKRRFRQSLGEMG